jgi:hypothetical protein
MGTPDSQTDARIGRSDGDRVKDQRLTLGDLPASPDEPEYGGSDVVEWGGRSQQRP